MSGLQSMAYEYSSSAKNRLLLWLLFISSLTRGCFFSDDPQLRNYHVNTQMFGPCNMTLAECPISLSPWSLSTPPINNLTAVVRFLQNNNSSGDHISLVSMSWKIPDRFQSVIGFLIHVQADNKQIFCYFLDLDRSRLTALVANDAEIELNFPLSPNDYSLRVHSRSTLLSFVNASDYLVPQVVLNTKSRSPDDQNVPAYWITDLVVRNESCNHSVSVTFEFAPDVYQFVAYVAHLRKKPPPSNQFVSSTKVSVEKDQRHGHALFTDVPVGQYYLAVVPENTDWNGKCRCRKCNVVQNPNCRVGCNINYGCTESHSNVFSINIVQEVDCLIKYDEPVPFTKVVGIATGCVVAVLIFFFIIWFLRHPKNKDVDISELSETPVFILNSYDRARNRDIIHTLVHFLRRYKLCVRTCEDVADEIAPNVYFFVDNLLSSKDEKFLLLVIDSGDLSRSQSSLMSSEDGTAGPLDDLQSNFLMQLRSRPERHHKLTIARFKRATTAKADDVVNLANVAYVPFVLVEELEKMILHLHGFENRSGRIWSMRRPTVYSLHNFRDLFAHGAEGKQLRRAILLLNYNPIDADLRRFEVDYHPQPRASVPTFSIRPLPSWFEDNHLQLNTPVYPTFCENQSPPVIVSPLRPCSGTAEGSVDPEYDSGIASGEFKDSTSIPQNAYLRSRPREVSREPGFSWSSGVFSSPIIPPSLDDDDVSSVTSEEKILLFRSLNKDYDDDYSDNSFVAGQRI